ncbi:MAG: SLC13 family permease [Fimbriimonadaceae bacterium]
MDWQGWFSMGVVVLLLTVLAGTSIAADMAFVAALALLLVTGILNPKEALAGFSNEGMLTVAVLYVVAVGVKNTGVIGWISKSVLGKPKTVASAQARVMLPTAFASAWLNNTPVVAMMIPAILEWCKVIRVSPSKLLIPLSYAAIFGGVTTLIGTSTNLVVNGFIQEAGLPGLKMFSNTTVGLPLAIVGIVSVIFLSRWLLPDRKPAVDISDDARQYTVELIVDPAGPIVGKSIEEAGLRSLPNVFLAEIQRGDNVIPSVSPREVLQADDRLIFVGVVESVIDLQKVRGLLPAADQLFKLETPRHQRILVEAVVSDSCPILGKTIREGRFRNRYNAVVIAVARNGERLNQRIGDIVLKAGDTLLLETRPSFAIQQRNNPDFFLVSGVEDSTPVRHDKAIIATCILAGFVGLATFDVLPMFIAALLGACAMVATGCCTVNAARKSIEWPVLIVIACSFGIGKALEKTGAAGLIAETAVGLVGTSPVASLITIYIITWIFTEIITNNAAAALAFPISMAISQKLGVSVMPFAIAIMMAASMSFSTPIGYQTNLMVQGPGGYRFTDFFRIGIWLNLAMGSAAIFLILQFWKF